MVRWSVGCLLVGLVDLGHKGVFSIYQVMLDWKTCKYYHEADELPNPRKIRLKVAFGPFFFLTVDKFSWVGIDSM